jgi:hypothetical protein
MQLTYKTHIGWNIAVYKKISIFCEHKEKKIHENVNKNIGKN